MENHAPNLFVHIELALVAHEHSVIVFFVIRNMHFLFLLMASSHLENGKCLVG